MKKRDPSLRARAKKRLGEKPARIEGRDAPWLLEELKVHQVELEMQNEELRRVRDELETQLKEYASLYDFAPVGFASLSEEGVISRLNLAGATLLGLERSRLVGRRLALSLEPASRPALEDFLKEWRSGASPRARDLQVLGPRESRRILQITADQRHEEPECRVALQDVSERTGQLAQANEDLEKQSEEKVGLLAQLRQTQKLEAVGLLAGGIAHDFNNLVSSILGNNHFLLQGLPEDDPLREFCLEIGRSADVATSLTRQLLAVSRRQVLQPRLIDPNSVILPLAKMLKGLLGSSVKLEVRPHAGVWPVVMDSGQLEQLVLNLAINARDAMPSGGSLVLATRNESVEAGTGSPPAGHYFVLEVQDTGQGMDAATQARIFEPFFTTKASGRGTGLGLTTVQSIVKQAKGAIAVQSRPGHGTLFRIFIPRAEGGAEVLAAGGTPATAKAAGQERVLVVDDNDGLRDIIRRLLKQKGYRAQLLRDAEQALERFSEGQEKFDLLLTDVVLPGLDGVALAQRLRQKLPELKVIFMSGYAGSALGALGDTKDAILLEKPFSPEKLLGALRRAFCPPAS